MRKNANKTLVKVVDYIKRAIAQHPIVEEGKAYRPEVLYMNGNDGTSFDWACNDCTCEFFVFYEGGSDALGYVKVFVTRDGYIRGYLWDTERYGDAIRLNPEPLVKEGSKYLPADYLSQEEAIAFKTYLCHKTDYRKIYDSVIATL